MKRFALPGTPRDQVWIWYLAGTFTVPRRRWPETGR